MTNKRIIIVGMVFGGIRASRQAGWKDSSGAGLDAARHPPDFKGLELPSAIFCDLRAMGDGLIKKIDKVVPNGRAAC